MVRGLLLGALLALGGCQNTLPLRMPALPAGGVELDQTPFFPQTAFQCGPAALATVLAASGVAVRPDDLAPQVFLPGRKGSLQLELIAATRRHHRIPYPLSPTPEALLAELHAGRPVLVLQNLGVSWLPVWHYAVVVGFDPADQVVVLRSGTDRRQRMRWHRFLASWLRAERWALVTTPPEAIPATATVLPWLQAAAAFEGLGRIDLATRAYETASRRWPDHALVWQVLGNARYASGNPLAARAAYRRAVDLTPDAAAWNNLAQTELDLGCIDAARDALAQAQRGEASPPVRQAIAETAAALAQAAPPPACQP